MSIPLRLSIIFLLLVLAFNVYSQENSSLISYGPQASTREGDDDFRQIIYFQIPQSLRDTLYLRLFDADCGGENDSKYTEWDTPMSYKFCGGSGAFSQPEIKTPQNIYNSAFSGTLLTEKTFTQDPFADNHWINLAAFHPASGELLNGSYYFKLVVEGVSGDDGNVYDVFVSTQPKRNAAPKGTSIFNYTPTIRLPETGIFAEMRCLVPRKLSSLHIYNFDISGGKMGLETAFRSNVAVKSSGQDTWADTTLALEEKETGRMCALTFEGGVEIPNDATFYILGDDGAALPFQLPIYIRQVNNRPSPQVKWITMSDGKSLVFDAMNTTDADGDALEFFWDFGDGNSGKGERVSHTYVQPGNYTASLVVTDNSGQVGNSAYHTFSVTLNIPPAADAGDDLIGAPKEVINFDAGKSSDPDGQIIRYLWDFGDGKRQEGMQVSHSYSRAGHYPVTLRVQDNSSSPLNAGSDQIDAWINSPPVVIAGKDFPCSPEQTVTLSGKQSYDADGEIVDYFWDLGDNSQKTGREIDHSYPTPGKYTIKLTVADNAGAINSESSHQFVITVNDPPLPEIEIDRMRVAVGEDIGFSGKKSVDRDGKIIEYSWDFGDRGSANGAAVKHAYDSPGRYWVTLTVQDNSTTDSEFRDTKKEVIINYPPVAEAGTDQWVTASQLFFDGSVSSDQDGSIIAYNWDFGDGGKGGGAKPSHVYANPGIYTVKLTVTDDSETSSKQRSDKLKVIVNSLPAADAGPDQIAAPKQEIKFDASESIDLDGEISRYEWNFGDGTVKTGEKATYSYAKPGIYTVTLTVQDNTGHSNASSSDEMVVTVNAPPAADAGKDIVAAPGDMVYFDSGKSRDTDGKIVHYRWEFSDGEKAIETAKASRIFKEPGIYTALLTVFDNSGAVNNQAQDKVLIKINHQPVSDAGKDILTNKLTVQFDGSASLDADGDHLGYVWDFGDSSPRKAGKKVEHIYRKGGKYPVMLLVDDGCGLNNSQHTSSITVFINQAPSASAGKDTTVCASDVVLFDGSGSSDPESGTLKYDWDFGDGTKAEGVNPAKTFTKGGIYQVKLKVTDDSGLAGNEDIDQIAVRVAESPIAEAGDDQVVGVNQEVHFDGSRSTDLDGLVNSYFWDFGDGGTGGGATPTHFYIAPGVYRVTLTITGDKIGNCSNRDSDELTVTVHDAPVAVIDALPSAPVKIPVKFDASASHSRMSEIVSFNWDFGDGKTGSGKIAEHTFTSPGSFIVTLKVTTSSQTLYNSNTTQKLIVINDAPISEAGEIQVTGIEETVYLNGAKSSDSDGAVTKFLWDFGDGSSGEGIRAGHKYAQSGRYKVILKVLDDTQLANNYGIDSTEVIVNAPPQAVIRCPLWVCPGEVVNFDASTSFDADGVIGAFIWIFPGGIENQGTEVTYTFNQPGKYQVTLKADDGVGVGNSIDDTTITVNVNYSPSAFSGGDRIAAPGEELAFDASQSCDLDGKITNYDWTFGDGDYTAGIKAKHIYAKPGSYQLELKVTDDSDTRCAGTVEKAIVRVNAAPTANAGIDRAVFCGGALDVVEFDASASRDADGDPLTYNWDFGDGAKAAGWKTSHKYLKPGVYKVKLTVDDHTGAINAIAVDEAVITVEVRK